MAVAASASSPAELMLQELWIDRLGHWELNLGSLQECYVLLTSEQSSQSPFFLTKKAIINMLFKFFWY